MRAWLATSFVVVGLSFGLTACEFGAKQTPRQSAQQTVAANSKQAQPSSVVPFDRNQRITLPEGTLSYPQDALPRLLNEQEPTSPIQGVSLLAPSYEAE